MIPSKNECVSTGDLSYLTVESIFDACWASMNIGSESPIGWNHSSHAPPSQFHLHCGIEHTAIIGIICIMCHPVIRHPSEHGTCSMWKHLLAISSHGKVTQINRVGSDSIEYLYGQSNCCCYPADTRKSRNFNSKFPKEIHIAHLGLIHSD